MERTLFVILGTFALTVGLIACGNSSDSSTSTSALTIDESASKTDLEEPVADSSSEESTAENPTENIDEDDSITIFEESPKKLLREEIWHSSEDGHVLQSYYYEYDEAGHLSKCTNYSDSGEINSWREYEYDGNGRMIYSADVCKPDGSIDTWCKYEYNENGKKIHETKGGSTGANKFSNYLCEYEYDNNGNLIRATQTTDELTIVIQEASYDNSGNQLEAKTYNDDGSICTWSEYGYDSIAN